jgi:uracil-DNA glycosylase
MTSRRKSPKMTLSLKLSRQTCPMCKNDLVIPQEGNRWLTIISEYPGEAELNALQPLVGNTGNIMRNELARIGIHMALCRITNIWLHEPTKEDGELEWHTAQAMRFARDSKVVLLLGSVASQAVLSVNASDASSVWFKRPDLLPGTDILVGPQPASLFFGMVGEFRLVMQELGKHPQIKKGFAL